MKKYNFNAGPSILPREVIEQTAQACLDFNNSGLSLMEISHRAKDFQPVVDEAEALLKELLDVPEDFTVLFLGGGASMQFCMVPFNFLEKKAAYLNTGTWSKKAIKEAKLFGEVVEVASSADKNFTYIPKNYTIPSDADYFHYTSNNTIFGTKWDYIPDTGDVPLVADMSSCIMSEPVDVTKFGVIYAGAQKNVAPAGVVILIAREDLLGHELPITPKVMSFKKMADADSMLNTPNCFGIYVAGLTFEWLKKQGGVAAIEKVNIEKANLLYDFLDNSKLFRGTAQPKYRSRMNVTFVTGDADKDAAFVKEATARGLVNLKGHRIVGGMRASIYNAMPMEGVKALVEFMKEFEMNNK